MGFGKDLVLGGIRMGKKNKKVISRMEGKKDLGLFGMQMEKLLKVKHIKMVG
jgi:hypothetical protein